MSKINFEPIEKIANVILYEGYNLYPYRPSARKNQRRWTFGRVYPEAYSIVQNGAEPCMMQTQLLVADPVCTDGASPLLTIKLRYLQVVDRQIGQLVIPLAVWPAANEPDFQRVAALRVGETIYQTWQEGLEQCIDVHPMSLNDIIEHPYFQPFTLAASRTVEPIHQTSDDIIGVVVREQKTHMGLIQLTAAMIEPRLYKITVNILNISPLENPKQQDEQGVIPQTFASTHMLLGVQNGQFLSLTDPPKPYRAAVEDCENIGVWPVLVGENGAQDMVLASPIILYDYPEIAPESQGDYFDGTEIDEMLALRVLTLTDEEKQEMAHVDEYARRILERTESFSKEYLMKLHGTWRGLGKPSPEEANPWNFLGENTRLETVSVKGVYYKEGDRVCLKPRGGADAFDLVLAGRTAVIEAIEQDFENNIHFAVVIEDDPGKDLGFMRQPGHRFFYSPDEVELLSSD